MGVLSVASWSSDLQKLSERELYSLSFEISEELVSRQVARNLVVGRYEIARPTPKYVFDSADDNYGAW